MKGKIFLLFFIIFSVVSMLIPTPLFPGNWFCILMDISLNYYITAISALFNGLFYGLIMWLIFIVIARKVTF